MQPTTRSPSRCRNSDAGPLARAGVGRVLLPSCYLFQLVDQELRLQLDLLHEERLHDERLHEDLLQEDRLQEDRLHDERLQLDRLQLERA